ncbi:MAG: UDP-4-amino-4,6-dideoxy-N-acetyl-beta-L-altrosamine transaminase, partial [Proteobacteria bacterium]|nr:UDP-4-amino-4,6-dideoxy-N-acetyl-beta-L-altrosamine transaminase [Pseudomonadota bacterium]
WTSPNSFCASSNAALYCGAKVDFVDIDPATYNMSVVALEEKLKKAKAANQLPDVLIPVHFAGQSCDMQKIHALSLKYGFKIIEDASHAIGALYRGKKVGACEFSNISITSFHPVKMITTGEGGMISTNDAELSIRMKSLRSHGLVRDINALKNSSDGPWYYEQQSLGYNYRMTEIQAALGISQLEKLDQFAQRRREIASIYDKELQGLPIQLPVEIDESKMSYHLYAIRLTKHFQNRADIFKDFEKNGIGVQVHYIPIYRHPYYAKMGFNSADFPNTEKYYMETMSIPNHPKLSDQDLNKVISSLKRVLA